MLRIKVFGIAEYRSGEGDRGSQSCSGQQILQLIFVIDETQPKLSFLLAVKIPIGNLAEAPDNLIDDSFDKTERNRVDRGHFNSHGRGDGAVASRSIGKSR
jgi:hypothetical protein